jgi:hypothetical protein
MHALRHGEKDSATRCGALGEEGAELEEIPQRVFEIVVGLLAVVGLGIDGIVRRRSSVRSMAAIASATDFTSSAEVKHAVLPSSSLASRLSCARMHIPRGSSL